MKRTPTCLGVALVLGLASLGRTADGQDRRPQGRSHRPLARRASRRNRQDRRGDGQEGRQGRRHQPDQRHQAHPDRPPARAVEGHRRRGGDLPGGGYTNLAWDHEGEKVADWLNSIGVTAVILKYRVPRREGTPKGEPPSAGPHGRPACPQPGPLKADDWGTDPERIGILGFSAGGHLVAWAATNYDHRSYEPVDAADQADCRPDFVVSIYPGGVLKRGTTELKPEIQVNSQTPPTFLAVAGNDKGSLESTIGHYLALNHAASRPSCTSTRPAATASASGRRIPTRAAPGRIAAQEWLDPENHAGREAEVLNEYRSIAAPPWPWSSRPGPL